MPNVTAYRRAPLMDLQYTPLSDASVHTSGAQETLIARALKLVDLTRMTPIDMALATKLGGYDDAPPVNDIRAAAAELQDDAASGMSSLRAAALIATMRRDKQAVLDVLDALRAFGDMLPAMPEDALLSCGADALRVTIDMYRRTGRHFLLDLMENLRAHLPDVSGLMHMFPFQREYRHEAAGAATPDELEYRARMERLATGKLTADALAMCALMSQFSGSGRDAAAPRAGMNALARFHGMPSGAFSADPYLAGRDPARAVELTALCAQAEAYHDALCATGDLAFAERLERLLENALPDMLLDDGVRPLSPTNRLATDESVASQKPEPEEVTALLRALYAVRRSVWMQRDDETLCLLMPLSGGCLTRLGGVPVRFISNISGAIKKKLTINVECAQPVYGTLLIRVPGYAEDAGVSVCGERAKAAARGELLAIKRTFSNGDTIELTMTLAPRLETGFRGSVSVTLGATLMALPLPDANVAWRYAVAADMDMTPTAEGDKPMLLLAGCDAPEWREKAGFILPPPQGVPMGAAYELTLIPFAGIGGRIAAFPRVGER